MKRKNLKGQMQFQFYLDVKIEDHPCYWPVSERLGHRALVTRGKLMYCERCGAQVDEFVRAI